MNLYEYSQVNNYEMGIYLNKKNDAKLFSDAYEEANRIIRASIEVPIINEENISKKIESENINEIPKCKCEKPMVRRNGKFGKNDFWGCSNFGKKGSCKSTIKI